MTGPTYPNPNPLPGSGAIGRFEIGVSPVGTIPTFDVWRTIISQYANSPILTTLITNMFQYLDQTTNMDSFFDLIWNVDTAEGYGLDVWGRIVGVSRTLQVPPSTAVYLGFDEAVGGGNIEGFGQAPFYSGAQTTDNITLTDTAYRTLILAKALSNICDGSIAAINQLLLNLFPNRGNCYVIDNLDMTMTYKFVFALSAVEQTIVQASGVLPTPAGVEADFDFP